MNLWKVENEWIKKRNIILDFFFCLKFSRQSLFIEVRNLNRVINNLILSEPLIKIDFFENIKQISMFRSISVIYENELPYRRDVLKFLLQILVKRFTYILIDINDSLIFLELGYIRQIRNYLIVYIIDIRFLARINSHICNELLYVKDIEVLEVYDKRF